MKMSPEGLKLPCLSPPTKKNLVVKDKLYLVFQLLWFFIVYFPSHLLLSICRIIFPSQGKSVKGQVVIVTGAGRGLGRGLAMRFATEGAKVAVVDVDGPSATETTQAIVDNGGIAKAYFTNLGRIEEIHQLRLSVVEELGPPDILVNNAGLIYTEYVENMTQAEVRSVLEINLLSHIWMAQEFLPEMKIHNSGHIVAISSLSAFGGLACGTAYAASKSGLNGFMESLRIELQLNPINNIKTTTVLPYFVNTSEHYVNHWDLRLPPISVEEAADTIVTAVKRDEVLLSVPRACYYSLITKLLPTDIQDKFYSIVYYRVTPPKKENQYKERAQHLISELTKTRKNIS